jgi:8-oxo-dGTP pyrophosphatase MutT (NUDIX family)
MDGGPDDHPVAPPAEGEPLGPPDLIRGGPQLIPRPPDWRLGDPAPWAALDARLRSPTLAEVRQRLLARLPADPSDEALAALGGAERSSAVLVALHDDPGGPHVVLTRRSWNLRAHRGEISFPGGRAEPHDPDLRATALRESAEEVGLDPHGVEILGCLDPLSTVSSRSMIVPYVAILPGRPDLVPDPREVEEIRHVALAELLADGVYREERWRRDGVERALWFFELHGDTVWGATAAMLRQLLVLVTGVDATHPATS